MTDEQRRLATDALVKAARGIIAVADRPATPVKGVFTPSDYARESAMRLGAALLMELPTLRAALAPFEAQAINSAEGE